MATDVDFQPYPWVHVVFKMTEDFPVRFGVDCPGRRPEEGT
jgi:hypothetical protein